MRKLSIFIGILLFGFLFTATAQQEFEEDIIETSQGQLKITFIGHGTLMFTFGEKIIHVDPVGRCADHIQLPTADIILVTH